MFRLIHRLITPPAAGGRFQRVNFSLRSCGDCPQHKYRLRFLCCGVRSKRFFRVNASLPEGVKRRRGGWSYAILVLVFASLPHSCRHSALRYGGVLAGKPIITEFSENLLLSKPWGCFSKGLASTKQINSSIHCRYVRRGIMPHWPLNQNAGRRKRVIKKCLVRRMQHYVPQGNSWQPD